MAISLIDYTKQHYNNKTTIGSGVKRNVHFALLFSAISLIGLGLILGGGSCCTHFHSYHIFAVDLISSGGPLGITGAGIAAFALSRLKKQRDWQNLVNQPTVNKLGYYQLPNGPLSLMRQENRQIFN